MRSLLCASTLIFLPLAVACASSSPTAVPGPQQQGTLKSSTSGLEVSVALASATLGDEKCTHDESAGVTTKSGTCPSNTADSGAPTGTGLCGGPCAFSSVHLALTSGSTGSATHVQIVEVSLRDAATDAELQALSAYTPLDWNGAAYVAWDEVVAPSSDIKAAYTIAPPAWSTLDQATLYSRQYRVRIVVRLDDATLTLESAPISRDPPVST